MNTSECNHKSVWIVLGASLLWTSPAASQQLDDDDLPSKPGQAWSENVSAAARQKARELFTNANDRARKHFYSTADELYREAAESWPHPAIFYNRAMILIELRQPVEAHQQLTIALEGGQGLFRDEVLDKGREELAQLEAGLARLTVICDIEGAEVSLSGYPLLVGPNRVEVMLLPGVYSLSAEKGRDYVPVKESLLLQAGRHTEHTVELHYWDHGRRFSNWIPWTTAAASAAILATGGYLHYRSARAFDEFDAVYAVQCGGGGCRDEELPNPLKTLRRRAEVQRTATGTLYATGAGIALTSAVLFIVNRPWKRLRSTGSGTKGPESKLAITPVFRRTSASLTLQFRFR